MGRVLDNIKELLLILLVMKCYYDYILLWKMALFLKMHAKILYRIAQCHYICNLL